jgi:hypothetical protein
MMEVTGDMVELAAFDLAIALHSGTSRTDAPRSELEAREAHAPSLFQVSRRSHHRPQWVSAF